MSERKATYAELKDQLDNLSDEIDVLRIEFAQIEKSIAATTLEPGLYYAPATREIAVVYDNGMVNIATGWENMPQEEFLSKKLDVANGLTRIGDWLV